MRLGSYVILTILAFFSSFSLFANEYIVTNTLDTGPGSLREAIGLANARVGHDSILFDIGITGVKTITLTTSLPNVTDTLFINGGSDPGYAGTPLIELNGNGNNIPLQITATAPYSHVHALVVNNAGFIALRIDAPHSKLTGSYIGTNPAGTAAANNNFTGVGIYGADHIQIGGAGLNEGNLISGNNGSGVFLYQVDTASISGNIIGTDISGTFTIPNANGIALNTSNYVLVGGNTAAHRNLVSGNTHGIYFSANSNKCEIYGNYVGTDISGVNALPNTHQGIYIRGDSNSIGGELLGQGNLVSGNTQHGIQISGDLTNGFYPRGNKILGNLVGTDISGTLAIPNGYGINLNHGCEETVIGGTTVAARNIISGNTREGIRLHIADSTEIYGNYIGIGSPGNLALSNLGAGIDVSWSTKTFIGNATPDGANIIANNQEHGIYIHYLSDSNYIHQNYIGTDPTGLLNLANQRNGIQVSDRSTHTEIGGLLAGEGNTIANNLSGGVEIFGNTSFNNRILKNSIYDHPMEGIRLANGNNLQEAPAITGFATGPTSTISGTFTSQPNTTYRLEFFTSNTSAQGKTFIGSADITTDATGFYGVNETFAVTINAGQPILTATATDPDGNTSPFGIEVILNTEISGFEATKIDFRSARLNWEMPESNEDLSFSIEHQAPGQAFQKVGEQSNYTSLDQQRLYEFEVEDLVSGIHHFRLLKHSRDGASSYSETLSLTFTQEQAYTIAVENPVKESSSLHLTLEEAQRVEVSLLDLQGKRVVEVFSGKIEAGQQQSLGLAQLQGISKGVYFLKISGSLFQVHKKIILE